MSAYKYEIEFLPTCEHGNADGLSRLPLKGVKPKDTSSDLRIFNITQMEALSVNVHRLRAATGSNPLLSKVYRYTRGNWPRQIPPCL